MTQGVKIQATKGQKNVTRGLKTSSSGAQVKKKGKTT